MARTISHELLSQGYEPRHLIDLAIELLDVACDSLRDARCGIPRDVARSVLGDVAPAAGLG